MDSSCFASPDGVCFWKLFFYIRWKAVFVVSVCGVAGIGFDSGLDLFGKIRKN